MQNPHYDFVEHNTNYTEMCLNYAKRCQESDPIGYNVIYQDNTSGNKLKTTTDDTNDIELTDKYSSDDSDDITGDTIRKSQYNQNTNTFWTQCQSRQHPDQVYKAHNFSTS